MITLLERFFIKHREELTSPTVRQAYGMLCGAVGILLNILLFGFKLLAGLLSGSVAIMADAFNNLSDAGSSIVTMIGFKLAGQNPDPDHPFGHGRIEYISGLFVAILILYMGIEFFKTSVEKIIDPEQVEFSITAIIILVLSILVKAYMVYYNRSIGKKIDSAVMRATAADSLGDCLATTFVLIATFVQKISGWNIDGYCGILVAGFILYSGFHAAKDTINLLIGEKMDEKLVEEIKGLVLSYEEIAGIHDLIVHDYGPGRRMVSLHAEVPKDSDIIQMHDLIDNIERELSTKLHCHAVIHMDPIASKDEEVVALRMEVESIVKGIHEKMSIHDFRIVEGPTHTNLIFDVLVPFAVKETEEEIKRRIEELILAHNETYYAVIQIDRSYVGD